MPLVLFSAPEYSHRDGRNAAGTNRLVGVLQHGTTPQRRGAIDGNRGSMHPMTEPANNLRQRATLLQAPGVADGKTALDRLRGSSSDDETVDRHTVNPALKAGLALEAVLWKGCAIH
jgi:hypothetical protein